MVFGNSVYLFPRFILIFWGSFSAELRLVIPYFKVNKQIKQKSYI
jgi:hypothetical protein